MIKWQKRADEITLYIHELEEENARLKAENKQLKIKAAELEAKNRELGLWSGIHD